MSEAPAKSRIRRFVEWRGWKTWRGVFFLILLVVFTWPYMFLGSVLIEEGNTSRLDQTQSALIDAVYQASSAEEGAAGTAGSIRSRFSRSFPYYTDGIIEPLWPWLMSGNADLPPDELFRRGKWFNLISCGVILVLLAVAASRAFSFFGVAAMVSLGGFGGILERSTFFSPDAIYFLLVVLTWLCALSLIRRNPLWLYGIFGFLLGVTYLTKPFIWPIVGGFLIVSVLRSIAILVRSKKAANTEDPWILSNQLVGLAMAVTAFLIVTGPRMSYSSDQFGDPFHTYSKYFIWMDSTGEAVSFRQNYPSANELDELSLSEKPGLIRYVSEHGVRTLLERAYDGAVNQCRLSGFSKKGGILVYIFVVFLFVAVFHRWIVLRQSKEVWRVRGTSGRWMLLFLILVAAITLFYSGVGNVIYPSNVMTTSLFLPVLITFIWIAERYRRQLQRSSQAIWLNIGYAVLMVVPVAWITFRIVFDISKI